MNLKEIKLTKKSYVTISFVGLLFFMLFLYTFRLGHPVSGLFCDEAAIGFNAFCLATNLHDETNHFLPFFIHSFGSFKNPVYIYLTAAVVKIFGLSVFTTRIIAVLSAVFTMVFLFLLARKHFDDQIALVSAIFLCFTPGFFHIQRIAFELTTFSCFFLGMLYFLTLLYEKKLKRYFALALLFAFLAWSSYVLTQVFVVSTFILFILFNWFNLKHYCLNIYDFVLKNKLNSIIIGIILLISLLFISLPILLESKTQHFETRVLWKQQENSLSSSQQMQDLKQIFPFAEKSLEKSNKTTKIVIIALYNYFYVYSPSFLFFQGDCISRHIISEKGPLPILFIVLLPLGFFITIFNIKGYQYKFLLSAFIAYGIPSIFLYWKFQLTHACHMYPFMVVLASVGACFLVNLFNNKYAKVVVYSLLTLGLLFSFISYLNMYFGLYFIKEHHSWQAYRYKIVDYIKENRHKYNKVLVSGQLFEVAAHIQFYASAYGDYNPVLYQKEKILPYDIKMLDHGFSRPNYQLDSIRDVYGSNNMYILNECELTELNSLIIIKGPSESVVATIKEI